MTWRRAIFVPPIHIARPICGQLKLPAVYVHSEFSCSSESEANRGGLAIGFQAENRFCHLPAQVFVDTLHLTLGFRQAVRVVDQIIRYFDF